MFRKDTNISKNLKPEMVPIYHRKDSAAFLINEGCSWSATWLIGNFVKLARLHQPHPDRDFCVETKDNEEILKGKISRYRQQHKKLVLERVWPVPAETGMWNPTCVLIMLNWGLCRKTWCSILFKVLLIFCRRELSQSLRTAQGQNLPGLDSA
jgi:hypothetical protein